jgi:hypothetical protein
MEFFFSNVWFNVSVAQVIQDTTNYHVANSSLINSMT